MADDVVVSFGNVRERLAHGVTAAVGSLLVVAGKELQGCDLGFRRDARGLLGIMRFDGELARDLVARLAFWTARGGGVAVVLSEMTGGVRANVMEVLDRSDVRISISRNAISEGLAALGAAAGVAPTSRVVARPPVLRLHVGGPGWNAVTYDPTTRHLFLPSPLAPPVGDEFDALVSLPGRGGAATGGRVRSVQVRDPFEATEGAPAGFTVQLLGNGGLHALLSRHCGHAQTLGARSAPRYRVAGRAQVVAGPTAGVAREQYLENLSHRGAYIRTSAPCPEGANVRLEIPLPHGESVELPATVVHQRGEGFGVEFGDDPAARARLDAAITELTATPRRVLVIDDDELARRMLTDALQERGLAVVAERDALAGLLRLAEEVFTLDLLVTDVMMPQVGGEELIRRIRQVGGERDLPILAVTASLDDALTERLRLAGVDAAVSKSVGPDGIADAAEALLRRTGGAPPEAGEADGAEPPPRESAAGRS